MKFLFAGCLSAVLVPAALEASPQDYAQHICSIVDGYARGSYHYFDCLDRAEKISPDLTFEETIDYVCSAVDSFHSLDASDKARCYGDAKALLACDPEHQVLGGKATAPEGFDASLFDEWKAFAIQWDQAYRSKVEGANNGLVVDVQKGKSCLSHSYSVSLNGENPIKDALKECVFTTLNAYSDPAISVENQEVLAADFFALVQQKSYSVRKLINASLQNDPITAFNTTCVLEIRKPGHADERLYLAGYTID